MKNEATATNSQIVEFDEFEGKLAELKSRYDGVVYDLTDHDQEKEARSDRLTIGKVISKLDAAHKKAKAPHKEKVDLIDGERKRIKDGLLGVQIKIKSQITEHERKIEERALKLQAMVEAIWSLSCFDGVGIITSTLINGRIALTEEIFADDSYEERKADAALAQIDTLKSLKARLVEVVRHEDERAELERLRNAQVKREQAGREEKIRVEAKAEAEAETEAAIQRGKDAAEKTKRDAEAAEIKAEEDKKQAIIDAENAAQKAADDAVNAERERIAAETEAIAKDIAKEKEKENARISKLEHRKKIHAEAKESLLECLSDF